MTVWGIHNDKIPAAELVAGGFIAIGWDELGDLTRIGDDRAAMRSAVTAAYPNANPGGAAQRAGVLLRFTFQAAVGDLVVSPDRQQRLINIGRISGPYTHDATASVHRNRRSVEWLATGVPRDRFTDGALREIGSAMTMFAISNHAEEFERVASEGDRPEQMAARLEPLTNAALMAIRNGGSMFTPGADVWTAEAARELEQKFVDRPDEGNRSFDEKLNDQLEDASDGAIQLLAELLCLNLAPLTDYKVETKRRLVRDMLQRMSSPVSVPEEIAGTFECQAFKGGVAFKTRRPFQLALLVRIASALASKPEADRLEDLSGPREFVTFLATIPEPNEPSQRRALSYLLFPDYFLPIVSEKHRLAIRDGFADLLDGTESDLDAELHRIAERLSDGHGVRGVHFYAPPYVDRWDPERKLSGVPITPGTVHARSEFMSPRYALATAAIEMVPEGRWTSYTDVADAVGLTPGQVGEYIREVEHEAGHRVAKADGTTYSGEVVEGVTRQQALEAEGVRFDETGVADPSQKVTKEDLRDQLEHSGLLPKPSKRAWLVRGNSVGGKDLVPGWLANIEVALAATNLRELEPGVSRDDVKAAVEEDYAHAPYGARGEKVDEFHAFLTRMQVGDVVVTVDQGRIHLGRIVGAPEFRSDADAKLVRAAEWYGGEGIDYGDIPSEVASRLKVQRDVLDLTQHLETLEGLVDAEVTAAPPPAPEPVVISDPTPDFARALHVEQSWLQECVDLLNDRPQLIFYGPPGTGKTYLAQKLAKYAAGDNVQLVQFHASYAYEDFMEGFRPTSEGTFELKRGPMRVIADKALENPETPYFLIIDEINRGNLAKVFGELYFLLEYRDENAQLLYSDDDFALPKNVFIIGTMNTADRSIALVDAAMRRRFAFLPLHPSEEPTNDILRRWLDAHDLLARFADLHDELNRQIDDADFKIGPSYFMRPSLYEDDGRGIRRVWRTSILPLLEEHHFGELTGQQVAQRYGFDAIEARINPVEPEGIDAPPDSD